MTAHAGSIPDQGCPIKRVWDILLSLTDVMDPNRAVGEYMKTCAVESLLEYVKKARGLYSRRVT